MGKSVFEKINQIPKPMISNETAKKHVDYSYQDEASIQIEKIAEHKYRVNSERVSRLLARSNLNYQDGIMRFARSLRNMGVDEALRDFGVKDGDLVMIDDFELEFKE